VSHGRYALAEVADAPALAHAVNGVLSLTSAACPPTTVRASRPASC
jgi:hypothetical protein